MTFETVTIGDATLIRGVISRDVALHGLICSLWSGSLGGCLTCFRSHGEQFPSALRGDQDAAPLKRDAHAFDDLRRVPWRSVLRSHLHRVTSLLCSGGDLHLEYLQARAANTRNSFLALFLEIGKERSWLYRSCKDNSINGRGGLQIGFFQRKTGQQDDQSEVRLNQEFGVFDYFLRCM